MTTRPRPTIRLSHLLICLLLSGLLWLAACWLLTVIGCSTAGDVLKLF